MSRSARPSLSSAALLTATGALLLAELAGAVPVRLAREPAPSPDGSRIAFSWHGDLFVGPASGGAARRLTVDPAEDRSPAWSPDGGRLAFASNRHGHWDVFVMTAEGDDLRRLTHHSGSDGQPRFSADGRELIFSSSRQVAFRQQAALWRAPADGSADPVRHTDFGASSAAASPDGELLAFTRGRSSWSRKRYRGSANADLWLRDESSGELRALTRHEGHDDNPSWLGPTELCFRSDRSGTFNAWVLDVRSGRTRQLTDFDDGTLLSSVRSGGDLVAFVRVDRMGVHDVRTGVTRPLEFDAPEDSSVRERKVMTFSKDASDLALSADGKEMAFTLRGELFVARAEKEVVDTTAARVTASPARDRQPAWLRDGKSIVFTSDRHGHYDLFQATARKGAPGSEDGLARALAFDVERLTDSAVDEQDPTVSPDGKNLAFRRGRGDLIVLDLDSGDERLLSAGWNLSSVSFSPDGRWLAFAREDEEFNGEIWIAPVDGSTRPVNVSRHPDGDSRPRWSVNGRALAYRARREGSDDRVALLTLQSEDAELSAEELEKAWKDAAQGGTQSKGKDDSKGKDGSKDDGRDGADAPPEVRIDFERIHERTRLLAAMPGGGELAPAPDGLSVAFVATALDGKRDLWTVRWDGSEKKRLTKGGAQPSALSWSQGGQNITYLGSGGSVKRVAASGGSSDGLKFKARFAVDVKAERRQVFHEAWRRLGQDYYDPAMHGTDWQALRGQYAALADTAVTHAEFQDVIRRLLGELNSSHLGIWGGGESGASETTGELGLEFGPPDGRAGWPIARVVRDSPANTAAAAVQEGERLLAIDDVELQPSTRLHSLLAERAGERVRLTVQAAGGSRSGNRRGLPAGPLRRGGGGQAGSEREVVVRPISAGALSNLLYEEWVSARREQADALSGGRVGFLHVRSMNVPSLERFEQELYSVAHGRDAIVIDVRNNGGGWTADYMLAILSPRPHATTIPRGGGSGYPQGRRPLYAWQKPAAALCNEGSFSNAEIFSHAMQTLGRGPLVGATTAGGVISTGGTSLLDGSWLRLPFRGWWNRGTGLNMEGNGAVPEHPVPFGPEDESSDADPQLERAVQLLVAELTDTSRLGH